MKNRPNVFLLCFLIVLSTAASGCKGAGGDVPPNLMQEEINLGGLHFTEGMEFRSVHTRNGVTQGLILSIPGVAPGNQKRGNVFYDGKNTGILLERFDFEGQSVRALDFELIYFNGTLLFRKEINGQKVKVTYTQDAQGNYWLQAPVLPAQSEQKIGAAAGASARLNIAVVMDEASRSKVEPGERTEVCAIREDGSAVPGSECLGFVLDSDGYAMTELKNVSAQKLQKQLESMKNGRIVLKSPGAAPIEGFFIYDVKTQRAGVDGQMLFGF